jgi:hypothetical protein
MLRSAILHGILGTIASPNRNTSGDARGLRFAAGLQHIAVAQL